MWLRKISLMAVKENLLVGQEIGDREASRRSRKGPGLRS